RVGGALQGAGEWGGPRDDEEVGRQHAAGRGAVTQGPAQRDDDGDGEIGEQPLADEERRGVGRVAGPVERGTEVAGHEVDGNEGDVIDLDAEAGKAVALVRLRRRVVDLEPAHAVGPEAQG